MTKKCLHLQLMRDILDTKKYEKGELSMFQPKSFAANVRRYRQKQHMTQSEIARRLFVTPQTVSKWENAEAAPDLFNLCNLAKLLSVDVDRLLSSETEPDDAACMIGIDGGNIKTELCLFREDGRVLNHLTLGGTNPNTVGMETACQILQLGIDQLMSIESSVQGLFGGFAGMDSDYNRKTMLKFLRKQYPHIQSFVDSDIQNVIHCVRDLEKCTAVVCGSGSVVYGSDGNGMYRLGGYGYLFDDAGSTYRIGRDVLHRCLMMEDGILEPTVILELTEKMFGGKIHDGLDRIYARGVDYIASFASVAFEAYAKQDENAQVILEDNLRRLTELILQARNVCDCGNTVIISGELTNYRVLIEPMLRAMLGDGVQLILPPLPPVFGACVRCMQLCGIAADADSFDSSFSRTFLHQ